MQLPYHFNKDIEKKRLEKENSLSEKNNWEIRLWDRTRASCKTTVDTI